MIKIDGIRPIPLQAFAIIYSVAILVGYGRWRWALKGAGWTISQKWVAAGLVLAVFVGLAALDAFYNHRFGFQQF